MKKIGLYIFLATFLLINQLATAQTKYQNTDAPVITKDLNGNTTSSEKTLVENLQDLPEYSQFVQAFQAAQLTVLNQHDMYTVFVVPNSGFARFDSNEIDEIFATKNLDQLKKIMSFHIVPGRVDLHSLERVTDMEIPVSLRTIDGSILRIKQQDDQVVLLSNDGIQSTIIHPDFLHKQGYFHIISEFLLTE